MKPIFVVKCPHFETEEEMDIFHETVKEGLDDYKVMIICDDTYETITCELFCIEKTEKLSSDKLDELVRLLNDK